MCRERISPWVKAKQADIEDAPSCSYFDNFEKQENEIVIPNGVYTLDDLKEFGESQGMCPYFLARRFLLKSNVIVFNYSYMLDPKIANLVSAEMQKDSIILFDECHNIDNACIEAFSLNINNRILDGANDCLRRLEKIVENENKSNSTALKEEIERLAKGLTQA